MDYLDTTSPFLPLPDGLVITSLFATEPQLVVHVACRLPTACCPLCQFPSDRIHGHYARTVADLPCAGRRVILALTVRKFVCRTPTCPRQIFTERLQDLVRSYARMTNRLREALLALALATSTEVCARLAPKLGLQVSPQLCFVCSAPSPALPPRRFAFWALMTGRRKRARSTEPCWSSKIVLVALSVPRELESGPFGRSCSIRLQHSLDGRWYRRRYCAIVR